MQNYIKFCTLLISNYNMEYGKNNVMGWVEKWENFNQEQKDYYLLS